MTTPEGDAMRLHQGVQRHICGIGTPLGESVGFAALKLMTAQSALHPHFP